MRKTIVPVVVVGLAVALAAPGNAAKTRSIHFTGKAVGNGISTNQAVFKYHDSHFGNGAGIQTLKISGSGGTDVTITYFGNATSTSKDTFKIGTPNAQGIATLTGTGRDVSGTGRARGVRSTYTFSGKFNTKSGVYTVVLKGTYFLP